MNLDEKLDVIEADTNKLIALYHQPGQRAAARELGVSVYTELETLFRQAPAGSSPKARIRDLAKRILDDVFEVKS